MRNAARVFTLVIVLAVLLSGCASDTVSFTRKGLTLTLPAEFSDLTESTYNIGKFDFLYASYDLELYGLKESKQELQTLVGALDGAGYAQMVIEKNGLDCQALQTNGLYHFSYSKTNENVTYTYLCVIHEKGDTIWLLQAACKSETYPELQTDMWNYLSNAIFSE